MSHLPAVVALAAAVTLTPAPARADATPGRAAPAISLTDVSGRTVSLADFRGRTVVLEWTNPGCPFVRKHYVSGNLPALQKRYAATGIVWLAVNSTNPDHADYLAPAALAKALKDWGAAPSAVLMDPEGTAGRAYGARTTPQMWVIDPQGTIRFAGGIDDRRTANPDDVKGARNHVAAALDDLAAGRPVATASAPPYGCSVKYR
jgi:peroxiredoxin